MRGSRCSALRRTGSRIAATWSSCTWVGAAAASSPRRTASAAASRAISRSRSSCGAANRTSCSARSSTRAALFAAPSKVRRRDDAGPSPQHQSTRCVSGVSPGRSQYQEQCIACAAVRPSGARGAHARQEPSGRRLVAEPRAKPRASSPPPSWPASGSEDAMAERARLALGKRVWLKRVAGDVLAAYHRPPRDRPRELAAFIAHAARRRPPAAAGAARADLPPRDGAEPLAGAADRHRRRPRGAARARPRPARLARGRQGARAHGAERRLRNYTYLQRPARARPAARARAPEAAAEGDPALDPARAAGLDSAARRRARVRQRPLGPHARGAAHRPQGRRARSTSRTSSRPSPPRASTGSSAPRAIPRRVAHTLTGLCTNVVPGRGVRARATTGSSRRLATPHLPQGAPTSPALANLVAFHLDARLTGLAAAIGAPLLALRRRPRRSPPTTTCAPPHDAIAAIAREEGFRVNARQDAPDGPRLAPGRDRHRRQRAPERPARRVRPAEGDPPPRRLRPRGTCSAGSPGSKQSIPRGARSSVPSGRL